MTSVPSSAWMFDFDNHYYEVPDAFTRYADRWLGNRGIRWADPEGRASSEVSRPGGRTLPSSGRAAPSCRACRPG